MDKNDPRYNEFKSKVMEIVEEVLASKAEDQKKSTAAIVEEVLEEKRKKKGEKKSWLDELLPA